MFVPKLFRWKVGTSQKKRVLVRHVFNQLLDENEEGNGSDCKDGN